MRKVINSDYLIPLEGKMNSAKVALMSALTLAAVFAANGLHVGTGIALALALITLIGGAVTGAFKKA